MKPASPDIHAEAVARAKEAQDYHRENRDAMKDDLAFASGKQWPEHIVKKRNAKKRPCLTFDRTLQFVRQVTGDIRRNPPALSAAPVDDNADPRTAKVLSGIIRQIERDSDAQAAYVNAVDGAAIGGEGHFRLTTDYEDDDSPNLKLCVRQIRDHMSVLWDPYAEDRFKGDARYCFVYDRMPLDDFKAAYPDADTSSFEKDSNQTPNMPEGWWDGEHVIVAEYWWVETKKRARAYYDDGRSLDLDAMADDARETAEKDAKRVRVREERCVYSVIVNGMGMLTDPALWPGRRIPIFTVPGQEIAVGDQVVRMGLVRPIKDAQRAYNFMRSAAVEAMALAPKAPMMATPIQVSGHEEVWSQAVSDNVDFLPVNPDPKMPGWPQRMSSASPAVGLAQEALGAIEDMYGSTGIYPPSLGQKSNESSGRAILARQREGETGTFLYVDNLAGAIRAMGREIVYVIPKIYDTERVVRILGEEGDQGYARLNVPQVDGSSAVAVMETGKPPVVLPSLDAGKYDVDVKVGPTFATRREEARESLLAFVQATAGAGAACDDLIAKNMDWPGADELAERLKPQGAPRDPKAEADAIAKMAQAEKTKAEAQGVALDNAGKQIELAVVTGQIQQAVAAAIAQALPMAVQQTLQAMMAQAQAQPMPGAPPMQ